MARTTWIAITWLTLGWVASVSSASDTIPNEIQQPGTQPGEVAGFGTNCDSCHSGTGNPDLEPSFGWHGSMMSHAARDPLYWATVAIAEQDFLPNGTVADRGGVGDLCLRCHTPGGWFAGRSTPTNGSALTGEDERGVECEHCHLMVDPDMPTNIPGTTEEQTAPFEAFDPISGDGYYGSGQYVINSGGTRVGPYDNAVANHAFLQSTFMREGRMCGTCHDVSNPAVGDLAHNNGAQVPLSSGFSGVLGGPIADKAAFNHDPHAYGVVERTYSEWVASALDTMPVSQFASLPSELKHVGGSLEVAWQRAMAETNNPNRPDYVDGMQRVYSCQSCHMAPSTGKGCDKNQAPVRYDLPRHDLTGGAYWVPETILYQAAEGLLLFGTLDSDQIAAMNAGMLRAEGHLRSAGSLTAAQSGDDVVVTTTNLTGHKLISGYPEGRRMWLNVRWFDSGDLLISENGAYGPIGRNVDDLGGTPHAVESLLDTDTRVFEAQPGIDQQWAAELVSLGYDTGMALTYDPLTDVAEHTLGELALTPADSIFKSFHFALNNVLKSDTRIPPYGFDRDEALTRNALPVPDTQYGNPAPGGTYLHYDVSAFTIPSGATRAEVRLYYQQTSWEYIQFLWLGNDGLDPFLGNEGVNMLDAWLNTGMAPPFEMAMTDVSVSTVLGTPGEASKASNQLQATRNLTAVDISYTPACDATDHTIYYGPLSAVSSYGYSGAACAVGVSGSASFDPGVGSFFFMVVGNNGTTEGSYGTNGVMLERPEDVGTAVCDRAQDLGGVLCE
ncbi:MAG: cytochrome c family protein [Acidobacteriota bacterium]|nr:cytochrome c family protein [Acidobacteriota bacterium]